MVIYYEFVPRCPTLVIFKKNVLTAFYTLKLPLPLPPPPPYIYHTTVWFREHGHKPQKQREMSCLLSSKEV